MQFASGSVDRIAELRAKVATVAGASSPGTLSPLRQSQSPG